MKNEWVGIPYEHKDLDTDEAFERMASLTKCKICKRDAIWGIYHPNRFGEMGLKFYVCEEHKDYTGYPPVGGKK